MLLVVSDCSQHRTSAWTGSEAILTEQPDQPLRGQLHLPPGRAARPAWSPRPSSACPRAPTLSLPYCFPCPGPLSRHGHRPTAAPRAPLTPRQRPRGCANVGRASERQQQSDSTAAYGSAGWTGREGARGGGADRVASTGSAGSQPPLGMGGLVRISRCLRPLEALEGEGRIRARQTPTGRRQAPCVTSDVSSDQLEGAVAGFALTGSPLSPSAPEAPARAMIEAAGDRSARGKFRKRSGGRGAGGGVQPPRRALSGQHAGSR